MHNQGVTKYKGLSKIKPPWCVCVFCCSTCNLTAAISAWQSVAISDIKKLGYRHNLFYLITYQTCRVDIPVWYKKVSMTLKPQKSGRS